MSNPDAPAIPTFAPITTQTQTRRGWLRARPRPKPGERIYAIGDVHGRFDLFQLLLERIEADNRLRNPHCRPRIIVLGDVIDRGPESRLLLKLLMRAQTEVPQVDILLGNHEAALLDSLTGDEHAQAMWLAFGGLATLHSYGIDPPAAGEDPFAFADRIVAGIGAPMIEWLRELPLHLQSGNYFFCHAGIRPGVALEKQSTEDLLWIRDDFLTSTRDHGAVIVHGHSIADGVMILPNRIGVDTGAYRTNTLSAVALEADQAWVIEATAAP